MGTKAQIDVYQSTSTKTYCPLYYFLLFFILDYLMADL